MIGRSGHLVAAALALYATPARGQGAPVRAGVAVVALDSGLDRSTETIAQLTRVRLSALATREKLYVARRRDTELDIETPVHWSHTDYRELAKLTRSDALVDLAVLGRSPVVSLRAIAHYISDAPPDTLPLFTGRSDTVVASALADYLLRVTIPRGVTETAARARRRPACAPPDHPYFEFQVDERAAYVGDDSTRPRPVSSASKEHRPHPPFLVQFVVDSSGQMVVSTLKFLVVPSAAAADSARRVSGRWRFTPARYAGCRVAQLVQVELVP
jgi:hypothetical protein